MIGTAVRHPLDDPRPRGRRTRLGPATTGERWLEPYSAKYFAALDAIWTSRDIEIGLSFTRMMYPAVAVGDETVAATDRHLRGQAVPGPVRRVLIEAKDNMLTRDARPRRRHRRRESPGPALDRALRSDVEGLAWSASELPRPRCYHLGRTAP